MSEAAERMALVGGERADDSFEVFKSKCARRGLYASLTIVSVWLVLSMVVELLDLSGIDLAGTDSGHSAEPSFWQGLLTSVLVYLKTTGSFIVNFFVLLWNLHDTWFS